VIEVMLYAVKIKDKFLYDKKLLTARKFRKPSKWDKKETTDADEREDTAA